ncbi:MAG: hexose kinase [Bdellovibrio sp.]|nr:hexose kinase [Bdellovibrio sp.]
MVSRILTITPNPSLDVSGFVTQLKPNEKTYVTDEARAPGGNAINVARILRRLGVPVVASGFLGGSVGNEVALLLDEEQVPRDFIKCQESTRINITVSNNRDHQQTRLSFPGPHVSRSEIQKLVALIAKHRGVKFLVVGGSLPQQFHIDDLNKLIERAQNAKMAVVVDSPGNILKRLKIDRLLLIKPNLDEFQALTNSRAKSISAVKKIAKKYLKKSAYVCVSSVEGGALLVSDSGAYFGRIPSIRIRSTVGAGDSMVAGMVAQVSSGNLDAADILRWGLAASAATLSKAGTTLGEARQIKRFYKRIKISEV